MPDGAFPQADPIVAAIQWIREALLGTTATVIATIAVAAVGALMLTGRLDRRRASLTILGCFIIFGAPAIGEAFSMPGTEPAPSRPDSISPPVAETPQPAMPFDPYAGAAPILRPIPKAELRRDMPVSATANRPTPAK